MVPGMDEVGKRFSQGKIFIPEMMIAARAMQDALTVLQPLMSGPDVKKGEKCGDRNRQGRPA